MARISQRTCKVCRRLGMSVCGRERCALRRRATPPGQHGTQMKRGGGGSSSGFGFQLQEKQKDRHLYGLMERQIR
ncbi:MAG: 30S ribosomal protein S4, partial [Patescibacteria group bacterium]